MDTVPEQTEGYYVRYPHQGHMIRHRLSCPNCLSPDITGAEAYHGTTFKSFDEQLAVFAELTLNCKSCGYKGRGDRF